MKVEILGSGGAVTIPRPGCACNVCTQAREGGVPYARTGPSVFVHGPDVLIDTPEESKLQLNRSQSITRIAAGLYSHWHPDHTAGRRVWEARNFDFRSWPPRFETTPLYIPERVWGDFERHYGLADQFRFLEKQGTVAVRLLGEGEEFDLDGTHVTPVPLAAENAHAFLFERNGKRVLVAMDETHGWEPPDLGRLDLAVIPVGVFEHHPFTGERKIPEEFCKPPVRKTRYATALAQLRKLAPARGVLSHVEEMDGMTHDDLVRLGEQDGWEPAFDGSVDGLRHATSLPVLWLGEARPSDADAVAVGPDAEPSDAYETVVVVADEDELEEALDTHDPEIFLLAPRQEGDDADPLACVLELLPDVPAGKLAIAELDGATRDDVLALERAGFDAVLVGAGATAELVGERAPDF